MIIHSCVLTADMTCPNFNLVGGYKLPAVGLGTYMVTDEKDLETALNTALEVGYRHIDTAFVYQNEHIIGKVLKKWFESGKLKREDLFVTSKLPGCRPSEEVEGYIKQSLESLQLDYLDLYLIHIPMCSAAYKPGTPLTELKAIPTDIVATWKKMEDQVELGRTKSIGISNFNLDQVRRILENGNIVPAANQVELHIYLQQPELVKYCQDNKVQIVSYQSLGNPGLTKLRAKQNVSGHQNLLEDPVVSKIAAKHKKTNAQVLLRFLFQKNIAVIPKSVTPKRIKENFDIFNFSLDSDDIKELEVLDKGPAGRISWLDFNKSYVEHPEYPFGKKPEIK